MPNVRAVLAAAVAGLVMSCDGAAPTVWTDAAGVVDAPDSDAAIPDAASGSGQITIFTHYTEAQPRAGIEVIFSDAAGGFLSRATSDATGAVHAHITAGDQATLVDPDFHNNITVAGLVPGDVLDVGRCNRSID